jgi:hypothetical protein
MLPVTARAQRESPSVGRIAHYGKGFALPSGVKDNSLYAVLVIAGSGVIALTVALGIWARPDHVAEVKASIPDSSVERINAMAKNPSVSTDATVTVAAIDRLTEAVRELTMEVEKLRDEVRR